MDQSRPPARFSRQKHYPSQAKEAIEMFLSLFHRYGYIYRQYESGGWISANEEWKLTDSEILKAVAGVHPRYFLGCRAGKASKFAVIDIDKGSKYHNLAGIKKLCSVLEKAGILETNLYQSSESGGWHLYIFFDAPVSSKDLRNQLFQLFKMHDFEIAKGTLEIFPHPGERSLGQGLRLPLQRGFAWINPDSLALRDERDELSPYEALSKFVQDMTYSVNPYRSFHQMKAYVEKMACSKEILLARAGSAYASAPKLAEVVPIRPVEKIECSEEVLSVVKGVFRKLPPGINAQVWLKGREYYARGLTGPSQRADAIFSLSHYLFYGDPEQLIAPLGYGYESERKWVIEEILKTRHHGQSDDISLGRSDSFKQIERASAWVPPHKRGKGLVKYEAKIPASWARNNSNRASLARRKIQAAVEDFQEDGLTFSVRDLALKSGVSHQTLYRHQDLWKTAQVKAQNATKCDDLETVTHKYNVGVGVASSKSNPLHSSEEKSIPIGLLAARRIAYEIRMREEKRKRKERSASILTREVSEKEWRDRVASLQEKVCSASSQEELRSLKVLASHLLMIAPTAEDAEAFQKLSLFSLLSDQRQLELRVSDN